MARTLRNHSRRSKTPYKFKTPERTRFFDAWDAVSASVTLKWFCEHHDHEEWCPAYPTASVWLKQRQELKAKAELSPTRRPPRKNKPGPKRKDVDYWVEMMAKGPQDLRIQDYEFFEKHSESSRSTLLRRIRERRPQILRSKRQSTTKISDTNKSWRVNYGHTHKHETVDSLWQWIHWIDEAHINRSMSLNQGIFREVGNHEGMIHEEPELDSLVAHITASVSWHHKSDLIFYKDEHWTHSHLIQLWKDKKPRRNRSKKSENQHQKEMAEWLADEPPFTQKKGNSMSQLYYLEHILLKHIQWIKTMKERGYPAILMEDGDPSYGHRLRDNLPEKMRQNHLIQLYPHPAQSPDLNPIEGVWLLLEENLKKMFGEALYEMDYEALKSALIQAWAAISMEQIRHRIASMQWRCLELTRNGGKRVKDSIW